MFNVKEVKEINFSEASSRLKTELDYFFKGIEIIGIPFFWNVTADKILINKESNLYRVIRVYIDRITSCDDIEKQLDNDLVIVQEAIGINDLEQVLSAVKLLYEIEKIRRSYIVNWLKAMDCESNNDTIIATA